jgi:hypothetical protein
MALHRELVLHTSLRWMISRIELLSILGQPSGYETPNVVPHPLFLRFVGLVTREAASPCSICNDFFTWYRFQIQSGHHKLDSKALDDQLPIQDRFAFPADRTLIYAPLLRSRFPVLFRKLGKRVKVS